MLFQCFPLVPLSIWRKVKSCRTWDRRSFCLPWAVSYMQKSTVSWKNFQIQQIQPVYTHSVWGENSAIGMVFCLHRFAWVLHKQTPLRTLLWTTTVRFFSLQDNYFFTLSSSHLTSAEYFQSPYLWCLHEKKHKLLISLALHTDSLPLLMSRWC